jgi:uncharacterized protein (UPF0332 family)
MTDETMARREEVKTDYSRIYGRLIDDRHKADYDLGADIEPERAIEDIESARSFVTRIRQYLQQEKWL